MLHIKKIMSTYSVLFVKWKQNDLLKSKFYFLVLYHQIKYITDVEGLQQANVVATNSGEHLPVTVTSTIQISIELVTDFYAEFQKSTADFLCYETVENLKQEWRFTLGPRSSAVTSRWPLHRFR